MSTAFASHLKKRCEQQICALPISREALARPLPSAHDPQPARPRNAHPRAAVRLRVRSLHGASFSHPRDRHSRRGGLAPIHEGNITIEPAVRSHGAASHVAERASSRAAPTARVRRAHGALARMPGCPHEYASSALTPTPVGRENPPPIRTARVAPSPHGSPGTSHTRRRTLLAHP